ncbi:hypothetical protein PTKIN_Ptkin13bG0268300 [Pterospermum kingtungense]
MSSSTEDDGTVRLVSCRFLENSLYFIAFCPGGQREWYELQHWFNKDQIRLENLEMTLLNDPTVSVNYTGPHGLGDRKTFVIFKNRLERAVRSLSLYRGGKHNLREDLLVITQTICEPIRFPRIRDKIESIYSVGDAKYIVTAGKKHLKFWAAGACPRTRVMCLIDSGLSLRNSVDLKDVGSLLYLKAKTCYGEDDLFCQKTSERNFQSAPTLPDAVACQLISGKLVIVYGDHSLHAWNFHEENELIFIRLNLCCENIHDPSLMCAAKGCSRGVSFATCSADGTIRLWDLVQQPDAPGDTVDNNSLITEPVGAMHIGFRSMAVSSDGKYMAVGDCEGNLHIYDLHNSDYKYIKGLNYPSYDVKRNFVLIESIDEHSAAVTSVKLACDGSKILSCSADRALVFWDIGLTDGRCKICHRHHQMASNGTVYDMSVDPVMEVVVTVDQVTMDQAAATSYACFQIICVYDFMSREMIAQAVGHGEVMTGVIFLPDCKHIVSVGDDGCIFVWKLLARLASRMLQKVKENSVSFSPRIPSLLVAFGQAIICEKRGQPCRISSSALPAMSSSQLKQRANYHHHGWDSQETYTFK